MSEVPAELKYSKTHEWVRLEGDIATIGITQHAEQLLGDIVFVELPEEGETVHQGDELGVVESVKAASDFYTPLSGEVLATNSDLEDSPSDVNKSPYGDGWLVQLRVSDLEEQAELLNADEYAELSTEEA